MSSLKIWYNLHDSRSRVYSWLKRKIISLDANATKLRRAHWKIESACTPEHINHDIRAFLDDLKNEGYLKGYSLSVESF